MLCASCYIQGIEDANAATAANGAVQRAELARLRCDGVLATSRLFIFVVILVAIFVDKDRD
jgi:hypothetical protein